MKKLFLYIFMVLMVCSNSFALDKKHSGEGELFLNEEIIEEYLNYLNTRIQDHPLNFFISEDKKHVFVVILKDSNYKGFSASGPISRNKKKCERKLKQKCYLFSNSRRIVWDNGINPRNKKESQFSSKISKEDFIIKLSKLGFIETEEKKVAKKEKLAKEKLAKQKTKKKKLVDQKAAKEKKLTEEKAAKEKKLAEEKAAKEKKLAEEKAAKEKKLAEEKLKKDKLDNKLSLIPPETELEKAQNFIKDVQDFIKLNSDEFDLIKASEFFILTRPILDGNLNLKSKEDLELFKKFTNTSDKFVKYIKENEKKMIEKKINKINTAISDLKLQIQFLKSIMTSNPNSIYLNDWINNIKTAENVLNAPTSYDQLVTTEKKLVKIIKNQEKFDASIEVANITLGKLKEYLKEYLTSDLAEPILKQAKYLEEALKSQKIEDINIADKASQEFIEKEIKEPIRIAEEKKHIEYLKTPEGKAEAKAEKEKKLAKEKEQKRKEKYSINPVVMNCEYFNLKWIGNRSYTWKYDGKNVYRDNKIEKVTKVYGKNKKDTFKIYDQKMEVNFYYKNSLYTAYDGNGLSLGEKPAICYER